MWENPSSIPSCKGFSMKNCVLCAILYLKACSKPSVDESRTSDQSFLSRVTHFLGQFDPYASQLIIDERQTFLNPSLPQLNSTTCYPICHHLFNNSSAHLYLKKRPDTHLTLSHCHWHGIHSSTRYGEPSPGTLQITNRRIN